MTIVIKTFFFTIPLLLNKCFSKKYSLNSIKKHYNILIAGVGGITQPIALILVV